MPQGRKKVPFSTKQKKKQLQNKREVKQKNSDGHKFLANTIFTKETDDEARESSFDFMETNFPSSSSRYQLKFHGDRKKRHDTEAIYKEVKFLPRHYLELGIPEDRDALPIPIRPYWSKHISKQQLDMQENKYFREFIQNLEKRDDFDEISLFELNLETWRQLWRVLEMSDILLLITDIRHPVLHFPQTLVKYITESLQKDLILVLNKVDLVSPSVALAWKEYFHELYPSIKIIYFCSLPRRVRNKAQDTSYQKKKKMMHENMRNLYLAVQELVDGRVDLQSWKVKVEKDLEFLDCDSEKYEISIESSDSYYELPESKRFKDGVLSIGCIGYPNVGKSSLMNTLIGHKVVSVSRTPGHTKYFQTIFLTSNVKLCDCPGLVFPSYFSKPLQVIAGSYPISQLKDPYPCVLFIAERLDLVRLLKLVHEDLTDQYNVMNICEAFASKKGFHTAKAARPDVYRAANFLLRMVLSGQICISFLPPHYCENEEMFQQRAEDINLFSEIRDYDSSLSSDSNESDSPKDLSIGPQNMQRNNVNLFSYLQCDD